MTSNKEYNPSIGDPKKILIIGTLGSGKTLVTKKMADILHFRQISIDDCRKHFGDGTVAGEYRAWTAFIENCNNNKPAILEFSGGGIHAFGVRQALIQSNIPIYVIWLDTPQELCIKRASARPQDIPTPYPWGPIQESVKTIYAGIEASWNNLWINNSSINAYRLSLDGNEPLSEIAQKVLKIIDN